MDEEQGNADSLRTKVLNNDSDALAERSATLEPAVARDIGEAEKQDNYNFVKSCKDTLRVQVSKIVGGFLIAGGLVLIGVLILFFSYAFLILGELDKLEVFLRATFSHVITFFLGVAAFLFKRAKKG